MTAKNRNLDLDPLVLSRKLFYQRLVSLVLAALLLCGAIVLYVGDETRAAEAAEELRYWLNKLTLGLFFNEPDPGTSVTFRQLPDTAFTRKLLAKTLVTSTGIPVPRGPVAPYKGE